jgi:hypothetical protein
MLKRLIAYPLIIFVAISCSNFIKFTGSHKAVDPELKKYVYDFSKEVKKLHKVRIGFKDITLKIGKGNIIGMCTFSVYPLGPEIDIDRGYWKQATSLERRALIYHELTHCYCTSLLHDESIMPNDSCPASIMYPSSFDEQCLEQYWYEYIIDLRQICL